jgi:hypothetical protein
LKFNCIVNIIDSNELRVLRATRDHVLTDSPRVPSDGAHTWISAMLYLKNTLGGLGRTLTDSALHSFNGPHRWWKLALYAVLFVLPGGSLAVVALAWIEHRRAQPKASAVKAEPAALPMPAAGQVKNIGTATTANLAAGTCQSRSGAPCRAAAGKQARQTSADLRV